MPLFSDLAAGEPIQVGLESLPSPRDPLPSHDPSGISKHCLLFLSLVNNSTFPEI